MTPQSHGDVRLKRGQDFIPHAVERSAERIEQLEGGRWLTNFDRYHDGAANLHIHFRLRDRLVGRELGDFCAILTKLREDETVHLLTTEPYDALTFVDSSVQDHEPTVFIG